MILIQGPTKQATVSRHLAIKIVDEGYGFFDDDSTDDEVILYDKESEEECFTWLNEKMIALDEYA